VCEKCPYGQYRDVNYYQYTNVIDQITCKDWTVCKAHEYEVADKDGIVRSPTHIKNRKCGKYPTTCPWGYSAQYKQRPPGNVCTYGGPNSGDGFYCYKNNFFWNPMEQQYDGQFYSDSGEFARCGSISKCDSQAKCLSGAYVCSVGDEANRLNKNPYVKHNNNYTGKFGTQYNFGGKYGGRGAPPCKDLDPSQFIDNVQ